MLKQLKLSWNLSSGLGLAYLSVFLWFELPLGAHQQAFLCRSCLTRAVELFEVCVHPATHASLKVPSTYLSMFIWIPITLIKLRKRKVFPLTIHWYTPLHKIDQSKSIQLILHCIRQAANLEMTSTFWQYLVSVPTHPPLPQDLGYYQSEMDYRGSFTSICNSFRHLK